MTDTVPSWRTIELRSLEQLTVVRWVDVKLDLIGVPIDGAYAEKYWLPVLGPTATWMARRLASSLADGPVTVDVAELGAAIGVGGSTSVNCPLMRALGRLLRFGVVREGVDVYEVRTMLGPVPKSQLRRLPASMQTDHAALMRAQARMVV